MSFPPPRPPNTQPYGQPNGQPYAPTYTPTYAPTFALLNDEPVADETRDLLGANRAAAQLTGLLVASRGATPFTLAVDAGWGMGKSSLMRLVDVQLGRFSGVHTVWYNAWTSTGADALEGLIKSVLNQVDPSILRRTLRRIRDGGALMGVLRALTVVAAGPLGVAGMVDELWRRLSVDAGARNGMRDALREMVGEWTATPGSAPGKLLVIFIDDLDRCSEETFLAVCEAVKVYLDVPGLAFVIGCDRSAIGPGGLLPDLSPAGAAFVEKIFQTSYRIPAPSGQEIQAYVRSCAELAGIDHLLDPPLVELLAYRAARNPRRVKRLVNGLLLEASLNPVWAGISPEAVIRTLLLQYLYPDFHRMMTAPAGPGDDGDVVREFLTYRHVRTRLWSPAPLADGDRPLVADFLRAHSLPPLAGPEHHGGVLADLEAQLPVGFPALAGDPAFVSLVDELVALPESAVVLRRLREGADGVAAPYPPLSRPSDQPWGRAMARPSVPDFSPQPQPPPASPHGPASDPARDPASDPAGPPPWSLPRPEQSGSSVDYGDTGADPRTDWGYGAVGDPGGVQAYGPVPQGRQQSVSPALDEDDQDDEFGFDIDYTPPAWYGAQQQAYPAGSVAPPGGSVVVAGFDPALTNRLVRQLTGSGFRALAAATEIRLTQEFAVMGQAPDCVVCHVDFAGASGKGFELVTALRNRGYARPVLFYAPRVTPDREDIARGLRAEITNDLDALGTRAAYLLPVLSSGSGAPPADAPRSAAPSVPQGRPSDGPPR